MTATSAVQPTTALADADDPSVRRLLTLLLRRYGIPIAETVIADGADSAVEAAWWLGFPVTLVADGARLTCHPEITRCGLATPAEVRMAYRRLAAGLGSAMTGVRIRRQPQQGAEVIVRVARDADGRAQVTLVLGGPPGALVGARATRPAPLTARDARDMLAELHGGPVLPSTDAAEGVARGPADGDLDLAALAALLEQVGKLVTQVRQLAALELNPVMVTRCGAAVAGVRGRFHRSLAADRTPARLSRVS